MRRIGVTLAVMREEFAESEAFYARMLGQRRAPDGGETGVEEERQRRWGLAWGQGEVLLAGEVRGLGEALRRVRLGFDERETAGRLDGVFGFFSTSALRRRQNRRFRKKANPAGLSDLLRHADGLLGVAAAERRDAIGRRQRLDNLLLDIGRQRQEMIAAAVGGEDAEQTAALSPIAAVVVVERPIGAGLALCRALNGQVASLNVMIHKLQLDAEELLILYRALAEIDGEGDRPLPGEKMPAGDGFAAGNPLQAPDRLLPENRFSDGASIAAKSGPPAETGRLAGTLPPRDGTLASLGAEIERYRHNRLVAPDAGRRRKVVDHLFLERFAPIGVDDEAGDAGNRLIFRWMRKFR